MSRQKYLPFLFVTLMGCSDNASSPRNPDNSVPPQNKNDSDLANNYIIESKLNLSKVGQDLDTTKDNIISLKGTGSKSDYKVIYNFNSGNSARFKVIEKGLKARFGNCTGPDSKMYLVEGDRKTEISVLDNVKIEANRDYKLEVQIANNACDMLEVTFDVIAWTGNEHVYPKIASVCQHHGAGESTFFQHTNAIDAYSSLYGKMRFLNSQTYCGEEFSQASRSHCVTSMYGFINDRKSAWKPVTCEAETDNGDKRSFSYSFNPTDRSAQVDCTATNSRKVSEIFTDCRSKIIDYKPFEDLNKKK